MSYTYTDETASRLEIKMPHPKGFLIGVEGLGGEYANIVVQNDAAPELALEILKAASPGPAELSDMADAKSALRRVVKHYEANALDKRRAEVCKELGAAFVPAAADTALKRAIDRIIELEQQAAS